MKTYNLAACDSNEALTLATDILRAAMPKRRHPAIGRALARVEAARDALQTACVARRSGDAGRPHGVRAQVLTVRSVFAGLANVVEARASIADDDDLVAEAKRTYAALFPEGTTFLGGTAADLQVECTDVLDRARAPEVAAALRDMGCDAMVRLCAARLGALVVARQGVALARPHRAPDGLVALSDLLAALRGYAEVVQAVDLVERSSLQDDLLAPLENRRVPRRDHAPAAAPPAVADEPEIDAAPPSQAA